MSILKKRRRNLATTSKRSSFEHHLEFKIGEGASEADIAAIIKALATISNFFGVKFIKGGGGSGGNPLQRFRPMGECPEIEITHTPDPRLGNRVGGSQ